MTQENVASENPRDALKLKPPEPEVSADSPWDDDALDRKQIAERLTNLIRTQSIPFVVSIDGYWGTGKTFMLKRWQKDLENQGFQAIYFNAWEDDFCDDPLLAIIGQLSEHFKKDGKFRAKARQIIKVAKPLFRPRSFGLNFSPDGISSVGVSAGFDQGNERSLIDEYLSQRATKDELKGNLSALSQSVVEATEHPLIFIIDELDRCRPTFAVELLERVKHIFDVPNLVFVFGINRTELCNALQSIYGEIDAVVYLRRFFDMEFILPEADAESFCNHLFEKFGLDEFFLSFRPERSNSHDSDFRYLSDYMVELWARLGLSLRDIDYCVRLVALLGKNLGQSSYMHPALLGLLIPLKFANPDLYRDFVQGKCTGSTVMDYIDEIVPRMDSSNESYSSTNLDTALYAVEASLYASDKRFDNSSHGRYRALVQLKNLIENPNSTPTDWLAKGIKGEDATRKQSVLDMDGYFRQQFWSLDDPIGEVARLIDFHQSVLRRR